MRLRRVGSSDLKKPRLAIKTSPVQQIPDAGGPEDKSGEMRGLKESCGFHRLQAIGVAEMR